MSADPIGTCFVSHNVKIRNKKRPAATGARSKLPLVLLTIERGQHPEDNVGACVETALYRIVQEALVNVVRHAHAARAAVLLERRQSQIRIFVEDDGVGFDPDEVDLNRLGLLGMREQAQAPDARIQRRKANDRNEFTSMGEIPH